MFQAQGEETGMLSKKGSKDNLVDQDQVKPKMRSKLGSRSKEYQGKSNIVMNILN
jgi:hypothetical protein